MKTVTVRNIPDHIYSRLKQTAQSKHRSLNAQILTILENQFSGMEERSLTPTELMKLPPEKRYQILEQSASGASELYQENPDLITEDTEDMLEYES